MPKSRRVLLVLIICSLAIIGIVISQVRSQDRDMANFQTAEASHGDIERVVAATGSIRPIVTVELGSQLSGQVADLYVDFNDEVTEGQLVALIDPATFRARVDQGEADLKLARAGLVSAEAGIIRAKAELEQTKRDFERNRQLAARGNLSESALDTARTATEVATANLMTANSQKATAEATIEQRAASLQQFRIDLERTEIRSPIDGVIVNRSVDVGQTVAASLSAPILFEIAQDLRAIQLEASVDESDIGAIREGNPVRFSVDAYQERKFEGRVKQVRLAPVELQNVVTYTVIIAAENDDRALLPGMTANIEIVTGRRENVLRIPNDALRFRPSDALVAAAGSAAETGGRGGQGGGPGGFGGEMMAELGLSGDQQAKIRAAFAEMRAGLRDGNGGPGGVGDPEAARAAFRQRLDKVFADVLTPEQMERYRTLAAAQGTVRRTTLWLLDPNGEPRPVSIVLGLTDNRFTEIRAGIEAGARIILREQAGERS